VTAGSAGGRLDGRVCLVTGSASGIGRAIALRFAAEGAVVECADRRPDPVEGGDTTVDLVRRAGGRARDVRVDLGDPAAAAALVDDAVAEHGRLDVLVNNAATYVSKPLLDTTLDEWEAVFAVNVTAVFLLTRAAVAHMLARDPDEHGVRGRIVNVTSQHGFVGAPLDVAYGTSKSAVVYLTRQVATDYGPRGIVCNGVAPGKIMTGKGGREDDPEWVRRWQERTPYPRLGRPDDVASAALFLASDEARYISGENLMVDGGWSAS
jgi:NAD(P)-dependent dehydrogenase (short-subunit alcohol dehydrogenase family)